MPENRNMMKRNIHAIFFVKTACLQSILQRLEGFLVLFAWWINRNFRGLDCYQITLETGSSLCPMEVWGAPIDLPRASGRNKPLNLKR
jgi:hypothetical protein